MQKRYWVPVAITGAIFIALAIIAWLLFARVERSLGPDPVSIASASMDGLREQNRLTVFSASYNATVTTRLNRLGLSARKTLILPGSVRYEIDLAKLDQKDVRWNSEGQTLSVRLPPIEIARPEVQIDKIQTYEEGGILMALTNAEQVLDDANRKKALTELVKQAQNPVQIRLARNAAKTAVRNNFAMPLRAAGLDARIDIFFSDEKNGNTDEWDLSRPIKEVLAEQKQREKSE